MRVWFLSAVVADVVVPLCYTLTEVEMFNYLEQFPLLFDLYKEGHLWLEEIQFDKVRDCIHARDYFKMYGAAD